jgi:hypothetical protein
MESPNLANWYSSYLWEAHKVRDRLFRPDATELVHALMPKVTNYGPLRVSETATLHYHKRSSRP